MRVHARWTATADRAPEARYSIDAADGRHEVEVDQRSQGGQWVALGDYAFAPGQPVVVTLGGEAGTLSADAIWFEPVATAAAPRDLVIDVGGGTQTQREAGRGWIGPEWASLTKTGVGRLVLDQPNGLAGPVTIAGGDLVLVDSASLLNSPLVEVGGSTVLDLTQLEAGYHVPAGQTIAGTGTISGSIVFGAGSTISPGHGRGDASIATVPEPSVSGLVALGIAAALLAAGSRQASSQRASEK